MARREEVTDPTVIVDNPTASKYLDLTTITTIALRFTRGATSMMGSF